jgi:hypothetical protein
MKKKLLFLISALFVFTLNFGQSNAPKKESKTNKFSIVAVNKPLTKKQAKSARKKHAKNLANSPYKKSLTLSKKERKALGIPPKKYYEMEWELTMDPITGKPTPEKLIQVREQLQRERQQALAAGRTPGDASDNNWIERGPNNVGGRVRAIMFDPNDATYKRVFAGGVSGGLWVNNDITTNTAWTRVNIPENLSVSVITYDPINPNIFYLGTGESYVGGDVNGDGVWKSIDSGITWNKIFGGISGPTVFQSASNVVVNSPSGVAGSYPSYPTTAFGGTIDFSINAGLILVNDGSATPSLGCSSIINSSELDGKIALIRRGSCNFTQKIQNAQDAGAVAVIVMNNVEGTPIPMGGTDTAGTIIIPSLMISKTDGDLLEASIAVNEINVTLNPTNPGGFTGNLVPGIQHINDIKVRNNGGVSELYVAAGDSFYGAANSVTYLGGPQYGLYKSIDRGANWIEINLGLSANNNKLCPNEIEISSNNTVWVTTTNSVLYADGGGLVYSSSNGSSFDLKYQVPFGRRTQIAVSKTNPDKVYVLTEELNSREAEMYLTVNGFLTTTKINEPAAIHGTSSTDFCRGQAFYDLMIEVDPTNDAIVYIGGIDIHRSTNSGTSWQTISKWSSGYGTGVSVVHADQHAMMFRPGNANQAIFAHDGGVSYASSLSAAPSSTTAITTRVSGLNITQFYSVGIAPTQAVSGLTGEYFAAGAQDNGTQYFAAPTAGVNSSTQSQGGDGAYTLFDQGNDKYYISNYVYNENINLRPLPGSSIGASRVLDNDSDGNNGAFIAPMILDSNRDALYSDYSNGTTFRIRRYTNIKSGTIGRTNLTDPLLTASPTAFAVSPYTTASTTLLVGTRLGRLLRLTTADVTPVWADISGPSFVGSISDVEYGASNNEIFVTMHNYNVVSIWYTKDGGVTWLNKEGNFPDIPVKAILPNPLKNVGGFATEVIIGTDLGIWYCNNFDTATPTWIQAYNGMSNVKVTDLDMRNDYTVYAATYGRGVFSGLFTNTTLSATDFTLSNNVKIYPNPATDLINVSVSNYVGDLKVELFDVNGRLVNDKTVDFSGNYSMELNELTAGVYIVKLTGTNLNYSEKIVVN